MLLSIIKTHFIKICKTEWPDSNNIFFNDQKICLW